MPARIGASSGIKFCSEVANMESRGTYRSGNYSCAQTTRRCIDRSAPIPGAPISDTVDTLILDLLEWMGPGPRPYAEVLDAWRTSCPRLPVWEDANDRGFIARHRAPARGGLVSLSVAGVEHLREHRQPSSR